MHKTYLSEVSHAELVTILDTISDAIFIDDAHGNTLWINKACEEMYKISLPDVIGKSVLSLEKEGIFSPSVARLVLEEKHQVSIMHQNREGRRILSTGIPLFDKKQNMARIITTSRDISELVDMKNQLDSKQTGHALAAEQDSRYLQEENPSGLIFESTSMYNLLQLAIRLSALNSTILITGESGAGKGVIAKFMHTNGSRSDAPFIKINCGAIPDTLLESELFGYEPGAFTGSRKEGKHGLFEAANGGTLFLDEISELPLNLQVKLLQAIQDREIQRIGGLRPTPVDVRIISATNKDLSALVQSGRFREDLFYRLNVVPIHVPALRERAEDIMPLANYFIAQNNARFQQHKAFSREALHILEEHSWPGNIRELENIVERLVITVKEDVILPEHIPLYLMGASPGFSPAPATLSAALEQEEKRILQKSAAQHRTTRKIAAALGISQPTAVRKLKKYGIATRE